MFMASILGYVFVIIVGYLLGSIPFGYIVAKKFQGIDIRQHGSGNIGSTNVFRVVGPTAGLLVFFCDLGKGMTAALIGKYYGGPTLAVIAGIAAILGHVFPVFLQFKGGKLVATGIGVLFAIAYKEAFIALVIWILILAIFRYVSLASIIGAWSAPITVLLFREPTPYLVFCIIGPLFLTIRHKENIKRLINGTESKVGRKA